MSGVNDCAAAMCECGDYKTYNSNMVIAIFFILVLRMLKVEKELRCFSLCFICPRQETDVKHCLEWWRPQT